MPLQKRTLTLYGNSTELKDAVGVDKPKIVKCKSNYYSRNYALEILPVLLEMLNGKTEHIFESSKFNLKPNTLRILIGSAWAYLLDHGKSIPGLEKLVTTIDWEALKELRRRCKIQPVNIGVAICARWSAVHDLNRAEINTDWNSDFREWLEGDMEKDLVLEHLALTPQNMEMIQMIANNFDEIEVEVEPHKLVARKRKEGV